jgi:hypothetical protein
VLGRAAASEAARCAAAAVVAVAADGATARYTMLVLLALARGAQNAIARQLAVPDMTTTLLTLTLAGLAADPSAPVSHTRRRAGAVAAMLTAAALLAVVAVASRSGAVYRSEG